MQNSSDINEQIKRALTHHQQGDLNAALEIYDNVLKNDPNNAKGLSLKGALLLQIGQHLDAVRCLASSIKIDDQDHSALANLAFALVKIDKPSQAITYAEMAVKMNSNISEYYAVLAQAHFHNQGFQAAYDVSQKSLQLNPENPSALEMSLRSRAQIDGAENLVKRLLNKKDELSKISDRLKYALIDLLAIQEEHELVLSLLENFDSKGDLTWNLNYMKSQLRLHNHQAAVPVGSVVLRQKDELAELHFKESGVKRTTPPLKPIDKKAVPRERRVIAFSLWGSDEKYTLNAVLNAKLMHTIYPGWTARFYVDETVPEKIVEAIKAYGGQIQRVAPDERDYLKLFWRFLAHDDPNIDLFMCRDCDAVINDREAVAVNAWMLSDKSFHIMRDHPEHAELIMAGMWGGPANYLPPLMERAVAYYEVHSQKWRWVDQDFLRDQIWPAIREDSLIHDRCYEYGPGATGFPPNAPELPGGHVGGYNPASWVMREEPEK